MGHGPGICHASFNCWLHCQTKTTNNNTIKNIIILSPQSQIENFCETNRFNMRLVIRITITTKKFDRNKATLENNRWLIELNHFGEKLKQKCNSFVSVSKQAIHAVAFQTGLYFYTLVLLFEWSWYFIILSHHSSIPCVDHGLI